MQNYLEHPDEEALERYMLQHSNEQELEVVETHILACDDCVSKLEQLEVQRAAIKLALQDLRKKEAERDVAARQKAPKRNWLGVPALSLAGACAAIALVIAIPKMNHNATMAQITLIPTRGAEVTVVPKHQPLHVVLDAVGADASKVDVDLVDANGKQLWRTSATLENNQVAVDMPAVNDTGSHAIRLFAHESNRELHEYSVDVE